MNAQARSYETVLEKRMPVAACLQEIESYVSQNGLTAQQWQENDFYLMDGSEKIGNAYHSQGVCYIYLDQ